jgi:hypothetical protein
MLVEIPSVVFDCDLPLKNPRDDRESFTGPDGIQKTEGRHPEKGTANAGMAPPCPRPRDHPPAEAGPAVPAAMTPYI